MTHANGKTEKRPEPRKLGYTELEGIICRVTGNREIYVMTQSEEYTFYTIARMREVHGV